MEEEPARKYLKTKASILLSDIIVDDLFQDNYYNVLLNIKELLASSLLTEEKYHFYQSVLQIDTMSNKEKLKFYDQYKSQNISDVFYEDIRKIRDKNLEEIKGQLLDLSKCEKNYCSFLSKIYGVSIYNLRESSYYLLVRTLDRPFEEKRSILRRACYSLISNEKTTSFLEELNYRYGYTTFETNKILHVSECDSSSENKVSFLNITGTNYVNRIRNAKELIQMLF